MVSCSDFCANRGRRLFVKKYNKSALVFSVIVARHGVMISIPGDIDVYISSFRSSSWPHALNSLQIEGVYLLVKVTRSLRPRFADN